MTTGRKTRGERDASGAELRYFAFSGMTIIFGGDEFVPVRPDMPRRGNLC